MATVHYRSTIGSVEHMSPQRFPGHDSPSRAAPVRKRVDELIDGAEKNGKFEVGYF